MNFQNSNRSTFSILFFLRRIRTNKNGEHPIYCRLTIQGKSKEFSTNVWIANEKWNPTSAKLIGSNESAKTANYTLNSIKQNLQSIRTELLSNGKSVSAETIVNAHLGKESNQNTLMQIHEYYNEQHIKPLIGKDYALGTYKRFVTSLSHIKEFMNYKYKITDIPLKELDYPFAADYDFYLRTKRECANNSTIKYIKNLKTVINYAVNRGWIGNNPLDKYTEKLSRVEKEFLTFKELSAIENKIFDNERLSEVRDCFIFCCYTGLAYADSAKLSKENITLNADGKKQISIKRTKTDIAANVPLLSKALAIIEKYEENEYCIYKNRLLPLKTNQKQNEYLKEIADLCGVNKKLTTHTARHTFATLMITNGVSVESVSSMLGHTNIRTTQIYAKIVNEKVFNEMDKVEQLLSSK